MSTATTAARIDWPAEDKYGPPPSLESQYRHGYQAGYDAAFKDIRERKALQREVMDAAIVSRFAEILASLRVA